MVDLSYTPGRCSRLSDVIGPPDIGTRLPCRNDPTAKILEYGSLKGFSRQYSVDDD